MIFLYIALGVVACAGVGKIATRSSDRNYKRWGQASGGDRRLVKPLPFVVDPVENPRNVDDGTEFGYKEFD